MNDSLDMPPIVHKTTKKSFVAILDNNKGILKDSESRLYTYRVYLCMYNNDEINIRSERKINNQSLVFIIKNNSNGNFFINKILESYGGR